MSSDAGNFALVDTSKLSAFPLSLGLVAPKTKPPAKGESGRILPRCAAAFQIAQAAINQSINPKSVSSQTQGFRLIQP
jgi:hypothetical protein